MSLLLADVLPWAASQIKPSLHLLLIFEVFPLRDDSTENWVLFLLKLLFFALRLSWDLIHFFSRWLKAELRLPCFTAPTQSKIAWRSGNNYLNLPPLVMLDHRLSLSVFHLKLHRLKIKECFLMQLLPAAKFWVVLSLWSWLNYRLLFLSSSGLL